jgi:hypothetical protein
VSLPEGSRWRVNRRLAASEIPSATVIPARWLGDDFGKLRSTGFLRLLDHGVEYESMRMPGSASVRADEARPDLGETYVLAEYTPDGSLGNMGQKDTPVLKAITFSRVDPREWQADSRADMSSGVTTAGRTEWLTVAGHKALAIHRGAVAAPDPPTSPNVGVTIDYLIVDMGDSTVLLQGANTGYRLLEQAATKLVPAR